MGRTTKQICFGTNVSRSPPCPLQLAAPPGSAPRPPQSQAASFLDSPPHLYSHFSVLCSSTHVPWQACPEREGARLGLLPPVGLCWVNTPTFSQIPYWLSIYPYIFLRLTGWNKPRMLMAFWLGRELRNDGAYWCQHVFSQTPFQWTEKPMGLPRKERRAQTPQTHLLILLVVLEALTPNA